MSDYPSHTLFTFQFLDLLIIVAGGLILLAGLTFLALKRRNEILREFLTPEELDIEKEFFKYREKPKADKVSTGEQPTVAKSEDIAEEESGWGTSVLQADE